MTSFLQKQLFAITLAGLANAAPFQINDRSEIRADLTMPWSSLGTVHQTPVAADQFTQLTLSDGISQGFIIPNGSNAEIWNSPYYFTPGLLLRHNGDSELTVYPPSEIQGFGITIEHTFGVVADYKLEFYRSTGTYIGEVSAQSPGPDGDPVFLGMIDPESRIGIIGVTASPGNTFAVTDPIFQIKPPGPPPLEDMPAASSLEEPIVVSNTHTYLHEGYGLVRETPETQEATEDNPNAHDLLELFPALRPGDVLRFNRIGLSGERALENPILGVFSSTETILEGSEFQRVPGAVAAGRKYFSGKTSGGGNIPTPTNIPQDFVIGLETHVTVVAGARYLFLSRAQVGTDHGTARLQISHIPRLLFLDWIDQHGLTGPNAQLNSDLDGDGLTLLEEFAYRKDPTVSDGSTNANYAFAPLLNPYGNSESFALAFGARRDAPLRYRGQFSSDLIDWTSETIPAPLLTDDSDDANSVFLLSDPDLNSGSKRFGRVIVEYLPPPTQ